MSDPPCSCSARGCHPRESGDPVHTGPGDLANVSIRSLVLGLLGPRLRGEVGAGSRSCLAQVAAQCLLPHPVGDLGERGARTVVVEIAAGRAAHADAADRLAARHDGHAAGREGHVRQAGERARGHARALAHALEDRLGRILLAHGRQRGRRVETARFSHAACLPALLSLDDRRTTIGDCAPPRKRAHIALVARAARRIASRPRDAAHARARRNAGGKAMAKGKVGVVGLGIMGGSFARNLVAGGWRVIGYDVDPARRRLLARAGVEIAADVRTLAAAVPVIITSLPKPAALAATVAAIAAARVPARTVIEASTFTLEDKLAAEKALRKAGHVMLDCPVSGTGAQARTKDLMVYASGDSKAIRRLRPLFAGFTRGMHDLGAFGNGSRMKYVANLLVAIHNVASAEAMVLGIKAGLDPQVVLDMVTSGAGNSRVFELRAPMMVEDRYDEPTMKIAVWQKDMDVIGAFARKIGVPTPMLDATVPVYNKALRTGHAEHDTAAVCAVLERMARVKRKSRRARRRG
ncbi:MAG: NAD(P)-dependent oxidoreductase [Hyphomicrobiales bacterium]|nr:NAD(P)-dependent oxidoreductase [Hyphomicrobiales bacterium]